MIVRVRLPSLAREGAETAADEAHVGEVHVAVDDVGDVVADVVWRTASAAAMSASDVVAVALEQAHALVDRELRPSSARSIRARIAGVAVSQATIERDIVVQLPQCAATAWASSWTMRLARRSTGVARVGSRKSGRASVFRVDGETFAPSVKPSVGRFRPSACDLRPCGFGIHVVGRHGRDAAPVVDAGAQQQAMIVGTQIRRRLKVHVAAEHEACDRDRASHVPAVGSGVPAMGIPSLARKFCTITSWMWPWVRCRSAMAKSASTRSSGVSPMPSRMPVVNGMRSSPASRDHRQTARRLLVGRMMVRHAARAQARARALEHQTEADVDRAQPCISSGESTPGVGVRQEAGGEGHLAGLVDVVDRRRVPDAPRGSAIARERGLRACRRGTRALLCSPGRGARSSHSRISSRCMVQAPGSSGSLRNVQ